MAVVMPAGLCALRAKVRRRALAIKHAFVAICVLLLENNMLTSLSTWDCPSKIKVAFRTAASTRTRRLTDGRPLSMRNPSELDLVKARWGPASQVRVSYRCPRDLAPTRRLVVLPKFASAGATSWSPKT
jgi:hypothetical protein